MRMFVFRRLTVLSIVVTFLLRVLFSQRVGTGCHSPCGEWTPALTRLADDLAAPLALDLGQGANHVELITHRNFLALGEVDEESVVRSAVGIFHLDEVVDVVLGGLLLGQADHRDGDWHVQGDVLALLDLDLGGGGGGRGLETDLHWKILSAP